MQSRIPWEVWVEELEQLGCQWQQGTKMKGGVVSISYVVGTILVLVEDTGSPHNSHGVRIVCGSMNLSGLLCGRCQQILPLRQSTAIAGEDPWERSCCCPSI